MKYKLFLIALTACIIYSCANQLPPGGGVDDTTPPEINFIFPRPNTTNFKDKKITIRFNEYVDRRSFEESFSISPQPQGEVEFSWSGKEVEVEFSKPLEKNRTYLVIVGNDLKDIRGSNPISSPITFAFSTGSKIDKGEISGKIYTDKPEKTKVLAYLKAGRTEDNFNPEKKKADYIIHVSPDGSFMLTNLPSGDYRIFAIIDEDRNSLYDKDIDMISVPFTEYKLSSDTSSVNNLNFILKDPELVKTSRHFLDLLKADSAGLIYSNVSNSETGIPPDYRFYFYFKNHSLSKSDIVSNFSIRDSANSKSYNPVFNWINDSLVEVFSSERFSLSSDIIISMDLTETPEKYLYKIRFSVISINNVGLLSGKIISSEKISSPVILRLYNTDNRFINYSRRLTDSTDFTFKDLPEGNYLLLAYLDENENNQFDSGESFPYKPSEQFIIYEKELKIKGGWNTDNVFIKF